MKKTLLHLLVLLLCLSLCACGVQSQEQASVPMQEISVQPELERELSDATRYQDAEPVLAQPLLLPTISGEELEAAFAARPEPTSYLQPERECPVIFIADGGEGDGSSPESPLSLVKSGNVFDVDPQFGEPNGRYDNLLYQAVARLYGTGGTVVLCGEVLCGEKDGKGNEKDGRDFLLPYCGGAELTITSVWDGVDYREKNGARLILQAPIYLNLNNPVTFRDVDLCTMGNESRSAEGRLISGCGFPTVVDTGVRCIPLNEQRQAIENPDVTLYPNIIGGFRYMSNEGSTNLTLRSGSFYNVCAGNYGIDIATYGELYGSSRLTVEGDTTIYGTLSGTTMEARGVQHGDVRIFLNGGSYFGKIQLYSAAGFASAGNTGILRITDGSFEGNCKLMGKPGGSIYKNKLSATVLDCADYSGDTADLLDRSVGFGSIAAQPEFFSGTEIDAYPVKTNYYAGDLFDPTGLVLRMSHSPKNVTLAYDLAPQSFRFCTQDGEEIDLNTTSLEETVTSVRIFYADTELGELHIEVKPRPAIEIVGSGIDKEAEKQTLGFLVGLEQHDETFFPISECGVLTVPTEYVTSISDVARGRLVGLEKLPCSEATNAEGYLTVESAEGLCIAAKTQIPVEEYAQEYTAIAYYVFSDESGIHTAYSQPYVTSVYSTAAFAEKKGISLAVDVTEKVRSGAVSTYDPELVSQKVEGFIGYMESMAKQTWICPENINFAGAVSWTGGLQYQQGETYQGLPYLAGYNGLGNLEEFQNYLDESGIYTGPTAWNLMHGNNCTSSIFQSISRFTNTYTYWDRLVDPLLNVLPLMECDEAPYHTVGDYQISYTSALTPLIVQQNGSEQVIYGAYAQAERGDFLAAYWNDSNCVPLAHLRLITDVHTVYLADGTVDGQNSYVLLDEQTSTMVPELHSTWGVDRKISFASLCKEGYLPTRDSAFITGYFETPHCVVTNANTPENISEGVHGMIRSNYDISEATLTVTDTNTGETILRQSGYTYFGRTFDVGRLDPQGKIKELSCGYEYILTVSTANETRELIRFVF